MVESQVRPSDVTDRRIIRAMLEIPRELFVPDGLRALAYMDEGVPVTHARRTAQAPRMLLAPRTFAKLVQLAEIDADDAVLDVGVAPRATRRRCWRARQVRGRNRGRRCTRGPRRGCPAAAPDQQCDRAARRASRPVRRNMPPSTQFSWKAPSRRCRRACSSSSRTADGLVGILTDGAVGRAQVWRRTGKSFDARAAFDARRRAAAGHGAQGRILLLTAAAATRRPLLPAWLCRWRGRRRVPRSAHGPAGAARTASPTRSIWCPA